MNTSSTREIAPSALRARVPYITSWSEETRPTPRVVFTARGIGYRNEKRGDRDTRGILWRRIGSKPGIGKPLLKTVHFQRQRRAMGGLLCQVCAKPTRPEATGDGHLFLLGRESYEKAPWPHPIDLVQPPLCLGCARVSVIACPHLRDHWVAVRGWPRPYGVVGACYEPGPGATARAVDVRYVAYEDRSIRWVEATGLAVRLTQYKVVNLA